MSYDPNKFSGSADQSKEMDPETVAHILFVAESVRVASRDLPEDVRRGLLERRESVRKSKEAALRTSQREELRRF